MKRIEIPFEKLKARAQRALSQRLGERITQDDIDSWDIRQVRGLIRAFPDIVPKGCVDAPIHCYIEDSEESPWIVAIGGQAEELE